MVQDMYNILERNGCINSGKKITFPSRAILLGKLEWYGGLFYIKLHVSAKFDLFLPIKFSGNSLEEFQWLLYATNTNNDTTKIESTVTIWGTDHLNDDQQNKLLTFIDVIGKERIYTDTTANTSPVNSSSKVNIIDIFNKVPMTFY